MTLTSSLTLHPNPLLLWRRVRLTDQEVFIPCIPCCPALLRFLELEVVVRAQRFTNFAIKAIYAFADSNWIHKSNLRFCGQQLDPVAVRKSVNCFYGKVGKTLRSHKCQF
jgi:hypothetical protein